MLFRYLRKRLVDDLELLSGSVSGRSRVDNLIRRHLVPEAAVCLIADDLEIPREEAERVREESSAFGQAVYGLAVDEEEEAVEAQAQEEKRIQKNAKAKEGRENKKKAATASGVGSSRRSGRVAGEVRIQGELSVKILSPQYSETWRLMRWIM
jgi:hypothetical protein